MRHLEDSEQEAIFEWAAYMENRYPELKWFHHIPNGGKRNKAEAVRLKRQGVKAGVSDMFLPTARGRYHGLYIELKANGNKPTKKQQEFLDDMTALGYKAICCVGADRAIEEITSYLELGS